MHKRLTPALLAAALLLTGLLSVLSIRGLQGNARVINYAGVVRGATQRLVKEELAGHPNDALIGRIDGILDELATGEGENSLARLEDASFQDLVSQMRAGWAEIKGAIAQVRQGADGEALYRLSESYFELADHTVSAAEIYSERQVTKAQLALLILSAVFLVLAALLAWYGAVQARRQRELQAAEEANRARRESLSRMSEDLRAPLNDISELMYVADLETHELLFINETGRKTFHLDEAAGQKCYRVLQGFSQPCPFCTNRQLVPGETYTWEYTNPITQRHYLLKDRLLEWEGRAARLEIAFDITEAEAEKQSLKRTLDAEQMLMECVRALYREHDLRQSVPPVLEQLGRYLSADRTYLIFERGGLLYNDYEWCAEGVVPQRALLQGMPLSTIDRWLPFFDRQECVVVEDIEELRERSPLEYNLLRKQDIARLVVAPLEQDGQLRGCVGVDNPLAQNMRTIPSVLQTLGYFLMLAYRRAESERELSRLSYYDTLTSFFNRNRFMEDTETLSAQMGPVGIVYLDVNGLKDINDRHGHAFGDKVLVECAQQMQEVFEGANFYRIGGDEFVIICPGTARGDFEAQVRALRQRFQAKASCRAAIGARWTPQLEDLQQVIANADAEMYEDKKEFYRQNPASNRYRHHSDEVLHLSDPQVLQREILQNRFVVYLQPKISSSDRTAVGAEALVRYQPRSGSLVLPGNFLPLLEESQTVSQIDFYVFQFACSRLKEWADQGKQAMPVSVNFSRCSLAQPDFVQRLDGLCRQYGVEKKYLEIEITETARESDGVDLKALIGDLRRAGFIVSIDDFGTEYANLALLSSVEFDVLKLDKTLVDDLAGNHRARTVVESIVDICKKMGIQVVAEGIETEEQLSVLRDCGVELAQGFLFSRPIPIEEYEENYL